MSMSRAAYELGFLFSSSDTLTSYYTYRTQSIIHVIIRISGNVTVRQCHDSSIQLL
jgi:hypothetical protein